jgi:hypothetical protein
MIERLTALDLAGIWQMALVLLIHSTETHSCPAIYIFVVDEFKEVLGYPDGTKLVPYKVMFTNPKEGPKYEERDDIVGAEYENKFEVVTD